MLGELRDTRSTLFVAPADVDDGNMKLIMRMMAVDLEGTDAWVFSIFNLLGVWPAIYGAVLLADGAGRRLPAWPFVLLSFALGGFALLPGRWTLMEPERWNRIWGAPLRLSILHKITKFNFADITAR